MQVKNYNILNAYKLSKLLRDMSTHGTTTALQNLVKPDQELPDIIRINLGFSRLHFILNPDTLPDILRHPETFQKPANIASMVSLFNHDGIFTSPFEEWARQKRTIKPFFTHAAIGKHLPIVREQANKLTQQWVENGTTDNLSDDLRDYSLNILFQTLFDHDITNDRNKLKQGIDIFNEHAFSISLNAVQRFKSTGYFTPKRVKYALEDIRSIVKKVTAPHLEEHVPTSLVSAILHSNGYYDCSKDENAQNTALIQSYEEIWQLIAAGYESTASSLSWAILELAQRPDIQQKLQSEIDSAQNDCLNSERLKSKLPQQKQFIEEILRLYPPLHTALPRIAKSDMVIGDGYRVSKNDTVIIPISTIQRDPKWFQTPDELDMAHMCPHQKVSRPKHSYLPFLAGGHVCNGQQMFFQQALCLLTLTMQNLDIELDGDMPSKDYKITLVPKRQTPVKFKPRCL